MFHAWTSASRLVSSSGDDSLLALRDADASRSWIEGGGRCPALSAGRAWGCDKMGVTSVHAVVALERRSMARSVMSSSAGCACCRARWCVPSTFGILMVACCCCQPCSASLRSSTGFSPVAATGNRNLGRPRERSCRVSRPRLVSAPVGRRASRFSCDAP